MHDDKYSLIGMSDEDILKQDKKPPIGLMPKELFHETILRSRLSSVISAIERYMNAHIPVPHVWIEEYHELINYFEVTK